MNIAEVVKWHRNRAQQLLECGISNKPGDHLAMAKACKRFTWRPIEAAPKDGTMILICTRSGDPRRICMAKYVDKNSRYPWRVDQTNYHLHTADLTHWMPLPEPPK